MIFTAWIFALALSAEAAPKASPSVPKETPELVAKGKAAYATYCVTCHGDKGDGKGPAGQYLNPPPRNYADRKGFKAGSKPEQIFKTITEGLKVKGQNTAMVGFPTIAEEDRWGLVYYVLSFGKK
ncbi:MAG: cytochrome c [Bacteriovoracia bacterium]